MKYALLIYDDPKGFAKIDEAGLQAMYEEYGKFAGQLAERGAMRGGEQLSLESVTTVRSEKGKTITTDGPFAETKEQLGGFFLIECETIDQALEAASMIPSLKFGGKVEVRPVVEM
jgi:hypothetical protein